MLCFISLHAAAPRRRAKAPGPSQGAAELRRDQVGSGKKIGVEAGEKRRGIKRRPGRCDEQQAGARGGREACFKTSAARVIKQLDLQLASAKHPCGACSRNPRFAPGEDGQRAHTHTHPHPVSTLPSQEGPQIWVASWWGGGTLHPSGTWCTSGVRPRATSHIWTAPRWQHIWAASESGPL